MSDLITKLRNFESFLRKHNDDQGIVGQAADALEQRWISVEDRLPEEGELVLVYSPPTEHDWPGTVNLSFDCMDPDAPGTWLDHNSNYEHFCVAGLPENTVGPREEAPYTYWMPLPEPPEPKP